MDAQDDFQLFHNLKRIKSTVKVNCRLLEDQTTRVNTAFAD